MNESYRIVSIAVDHFFSLNIMNELNNESERIFFSVFPINKCHVFFCLAKKRFLEDDDDRHTRNEESNEID